MNDLFEKMSGKRVLVTGHTGFKGSWLSEILVLAGADVTGYSLDAPTDPSLFKILSLEREIRSVRGDVRDYASLLRTLKEAKPDYVLHLAAQPLVRQSYREPRETFDTNVMGTVNLLEAIRQTGGVSSIVNVTTDKVYKNFEKKEPFREEDPLDGYDPYSNSKSCSDLVTHSYRSSFFCEMGIPVSTARAGNVIGGGDFALDRIVPDCVRAAKKGEKVVLRNPASVRPYQHVLEPLSAYLTILLGQEEAPSKQGAYNVGPRAEDAVTTGEIAEMFCRAWGEGMGWTSTSDGGPHEAGLLMLDSSKINTAFGWKPHWTIEDAVEKTVEWSKAWVYHEDMKEITVKQIREYCHV